MLEMHAKELKSARDVLTKELEVLEEQRCDLENEVQSQSGKHRAENNYPVGEPTPAEKSMHIENIRTGNANVLYVVHKPKDDLQYVLIYFHKDIL